MTFQQFRGAVADAIRKNNVRRLQRALEIIRNEALSWGKEDKVELIALANLVARLYTHSNRDIINLADQALNVLDTVTGTTTPRVVEAVEDSPIVAASDPGFTKAPTTFVASPDGSRSEIAMASVKAASVGISVRHTVLGNHDGPSGIKKIEVQDDGVINDVPCFRGDILFFDSEGRLITVPATLPAAVKVVSGGGTGRIVTKGARTVGGSIIGGVRKNNEDGILRFLLPDGSEVIALADGMGGHGGGERASELALRALWAGIDAGLTLADAVDFAHCMILNEKGADARLLRAANTKGAPSLGKDRNRRQALSEGLNRGTTLIVARISSNRKAAQVASVGDSRAYLFNASGTTLLTEDQVGESSYFVGWIKDKCNQKIDFANGLRGFLLLLWDAVINCHNAGNQLRYGVGLGEQRDDAERKLSEFVQVVETSLRPGDKLLLCSDGVSESQNSLVSEELLDKYFPSLAEKRELFFDRTLHNGLLRVKPDIQRRIARAQLEKSEKDGLSRMLKEPRNSAANLSEVLERLARSFLTSIFGNRWISIVLLWLTRKSHDNSSFVMTEA